MRQTTEKLLWILAGVSIFAVSATDPWWWENWIRVGLVGLLLIVTATVFFLVGVSHGMKVMKDRMRDDIWGLSSVTSEFLEED